jgi:hypothetical protein
MIEEWPEGPLRLKTTDPEGYHDHVRKGLDRRAIMFKKGWLNATTFQKYCFGTRFDIFFGLLSFHPFVVNLKTFVYIGNFNKNIPFYMFFATKHLMIEHDMLPPQMN